MTKEEWIWVAIRIFGVFLLVLAIIAIPKAASSIYAATIYLDQPGPDAVSSANVQTKLTYQVFKAQSAQATRSVLEVIIYGLFGFYFIRGGKALHKVICRE